MKINEIKFTNFRLFESFQMTFEPQATVIVGRNGTGKSAILDGIAIAIDKAWFPPFSDAQRPLKGSDARLVIIEHPAAASAESVFPIEIDLKGNLEGESVEWRVELLNKNAKPEPSGAIVDFRAKRESMIQRVQQGKLQTLPVLAHYRTGRLWRDSAVKSRESEHSNNDELSSRTSGYVGALTAGYVRRDLQRWMAMHDADRMQQIAFAVQEGRDWRDVKTPMLDVVSRAAVTCLEGATRFYYNAKVRELRVDFEQSPPLPFKVLSDGQKNVVAVAADIAWRAAQLNPHLGFNAALETPGIVLIDELDLHLHPAWQMRVLENLMRAFPKVQFIVTTHSPQIMSAAPPHSVRLLDSKHGAMHVDRLRGRDTNSILEDVLGVPSRPPQWKEKLERLARFIEEESLDDAERLLKELEQDEFYLDDPAIVSARWEIALARGAHATD